MTSARASRRLGLGKPIANIDALDRAYDRIAEETFTKKLPPTLCHYTDWAGLRGILSSRQLWAVDFRAQQTDPLEFQHADESIVALAREMVADTRLREVHRRALARFAREYEEKAVVRVARFELFITSFCARSDNPKLWRAFGREDTGFAVEFEVLSEKHDPPGMGFMMLEVDYDLNSVRNRVRSGVLRILDQSLWFAGPKERARFYTQRALWMIATKAAVQCKSREHAEDCEWRRVVMVPDEWRSKPASLVHSEPKRHVKVPLRPDNQLPVIRAIHIGTNAAPNAEDQVEELLARESYTGARRPEVIRRTKA